MNIDLDLYRKDVLVSVQPTVRLSVIDIQPEHPRHILIFIHGFAGQAGQWEYQLKQFGVTERVIAIDLRGHGRSDKPRGTYRMSEIQADLEAALKALEVTGKFVLIGHSFGGAVITEYACAHPERVEKMVLIATAGEFQLSLPYRLGLHLPEPLLRLIAPLAKGQLSAPPHVLQPWYTNNLSKWNGWSFYRNLNMPVLVIRGHFDMVFSQPLFDQVTRAIPHAEEVDAGASGHMVMLERRAAVNRALERFLETKNHSWRDLEEDEEAAARAALLRARPWLAHYPQDIPYTVAVPRVPLQNALLHSAARRFPLHAALDFEGNILTYRRLNLEANRFANALLALEVQKGDRVLLLLPNLPQLVIAFFGVLKAGAVAVFTLPNTPPAELMRQMQDADIRVVITLAQFRDLAQQVLNGIQPPAQNLPTEAGIAPSQHIILVEAGDYLPLWKRLVRRFTPRQATPGETQLEPADNPEPPGSPLAVRTVVDEHLFTRLISVHSSTLPEVETGAEDLAVILYTGGTTAASKGVMLLHRNLVANAMQTHYWMPDAQEGRERFLCALPFSHSYGLTTALTVPVSLGATLILKPKFETLDILKTIRRRRPTIFPGVPQMYVAINEYPQARRYGVRSIRACISGSAPLPVEVQEAFEKLTRGRLVEGYGLTEASPVTHANPLEGLRKVGSIGIPLPSTEARVVDLVHGKKEMPVGQIGELAVRGPQIMAGYWNNREETRRALSADGWLLTGDVAQMDAEGYFRIIARKADLWYPSKPGEPAFPRDVEEVLFEIPQVKEAAVVVIAGQPVAFIIARQKRPTAEALIAYCKRRLPPELVPRLVIFVDDFPRTFIGKVLRRELARRVPIPDNRR